MADEEVVVNLVYDARQSAQKMVEQSKQVILSLNDIVIKTNSVSESAEKSNKAFAGLGSMVSKIASSFEPWTRGLAAATAEANKLDVKIRSLNDSNSRNVDQNNLLNQAISLRAKLTQRVEEYQTAAVAAAAAQDQLASNRVIETFNKIVNVINEGSISIEKHTAAVNLFKNKLDTTITTLSSFANAQQLISNSTNKMTGDWNEASALMTRLTEKFNPSAVAAGGMTAAMIELNTAVELGVKIEKGYEVELENIRLKFDAAGVAAEKMAGVLRGLPQHINPVTGEAVTSASQREIDAAVNQMGVNRVTNISPDFGTGANQDELNAIKARLQAEDEAARVIADDENKIITAQIQAMESSKRLTEQVQIDAYNRAQALKQEISELQLRAEAENIAFDNKKIKDAADQFDYLTNKYNSSATAANIFNKTINELNEALAKGAIDADIYNQQAIKAKEVHDTLVSSVKKVTTSTKNLTEEQKKSTQTTFLNRIGMLEFQAAIINTFQALASGMNITHVAMMEGAQVVGAFAQGTSSGLKIVTDVLQTLRNHIGLTVVSLGALAVAVDVVYRGFADASQLRRFDAALASINPTFNTSSVALQKLAYDLRNVGVASADAEKGILEFARNQNVNLNNPNAVRNLATLGVNVGARLGIGDAAGMQKVNEVIKDRGDAIVKLGLETKAFTQAEAAAISIDIQRGDGIKKINDAIVLLTERLSTEQEKQRSGFSKLFDAVGTGWTALVTKISDSSIWTGIDNLFSHMANNLKYIVENGNLSPDSVIGKIIPNMDAGVMAIQARQRQINANRTAPGGVTLDVGGGLRGSSSQLNSLSGINFPTLANGGNSGVISTESSFPQTITLGPGDFGPGSPFGNTIPIDIGTRTFTAVNDNGRWRVNAASVTSGSVAPSFSSQGMGSNLFAPQMQTNMNLSSNVTDIVKESSEAINEQSKRIDELNRGYGDVTKNAALWNIQQQAATAFTAKYNEVLGSGKDSTEAWDAANLEFNKTRDVALIQLGKDIQLTDIDIQGKFKSADAFKAGTSAGLQADAMTQANIQAKQKGISVEEAYRQIVQASAGDAVRGAAEQNAAQIPVIAGQFKLAEAAKISAQAQHDVRVENEANTLVQKALDVEKIKGVTITQGMVQALQEQAKAQILAKEAAQASLNVTTAVNQAQDAIQVSKLQQNLAGQTTEEITRQVAVLQKKQELERDTVNNYTQPQKDMIIGATDAIQRQNIELANTNRAWQRIEDGVKNIADQIGTTLLDAIDGLFDKSKVTDWASTFKSALTSIGNQLVQMALIKPLTGTILGALGFGNLAQSFGTFGGLFGGSGTSGSNSGQLTLTPNGSGGFNLSTLGTVGGIAKDAGGLFGLGGSGNSGGGLFGNLFGGSSGLTGSSNAGGLFGLGGLFGSQGPLFGSAADISILGGGPPLALGSEVATSGLGLGSAAGILGSLGSLLPIAGIAVGLGSLLFGSMLGGHKPSVSSGGLLDLATGAGSDFQSSGGPNGQAAQQMIQTLSDFTKQIQGLTGGNIQGSLNPQVFTNQQGQTTYRVGYNTSGPFGSGKIEAQDAQTVINMIELGIARSLTGVSDTVKQVLSVVTDPSQIQDALNFAKIYDNLKTAADSAFSSLSEDTQQIGPFKQALDQINATFADISTNAAKYGLSLDPVNAGLKEATARLIVDVNKQVSDMILNISDPAQLAVEQLKKTNKALLDDVIAVGADAVQAQRYNTMALNALWKSQTQTLVDLQNQLLTGSNSGLTLAKQVTAANENFKTELRLVRGGNIGEIGNLATSGQNLIGLATSTYGNAPQTATIRSSILSAIDDVLKHRGFAGGTNSTPEGFIRVGENGPEWIGQSGNMQIMPNGINPKENKELVLELRAVRELLEVGNRMTQGVGSMTVNKLEKIASKIDTKVVISEPKRTKVA